MNSFLLVVAIILSTQLTSAVTKHTDKIQGNPSQKVFDANSIQDLPLIVNENADGKDEEISEESSGRYPISKVNLHNDSFYRRFRFR